MQDYPAQCVRFPLSLVDAGHFPYRAVLLLSTSVSSETQQWHPHAALPPKAASFSHPDILLAQVFRAEMGAEGSVGRDSWAPGALGCWHLGRHHVGLGIRRLWFHSHLDLLLVLPLLAWLYILHPIPNGSLVCPCHPAGSTRGEDICRATAQVTSCYSLNPSDQISMVEQTTESCRREVFFLCFLFLPLCPSRLATFHPPSTPLCCC